MCTGNDDDFCPEETTDAAVAPEPDQVEELTGPMPRRSFLKAAAAGAAGLGAIGLSKFTVSAHTDTSSSCTAGDIEVTGGTIINEPCSCTTGGTFEAIAAFQVTNNNNAARNCITLHLGTGGSLAGRDYLLVDSAGSSNISGNGTSKVMFANLGILPCNFGRECYAGSVVAFRTAQNQQNPTCDGPLTRYPGGQCRRLEICIIGFSASLVCATTCDALCGGSLNLVASATGGTAGATNLYTFSLTDPNGTVVETRTGVTSPQTFTVASVINGTYTLTVTDSKGCTRTATRALTTTSIAKPVATAGTPNCDGLVNYAVTGPVAGITYTWFEVNCATGAVIGSALGTGTTLAKTWPKGTTHCVIVVASNGTTACDQASNPVSVTIASQVVLTLGDFAQTNCTGAGTFTATATGGTGPYTFRWTIDDVVQADTDNVLSVTAILDGSCHKYQVAVTDSAGCAGDGARTKFITQCVTTTTCTPAP
jgi:hypothetical protein